MSIHYVYTFGQYATCNVSHGYAGLRPKKTNVCFAQQNRGGRIE